MLKKLDILILRSFIGPFLATFLIATFVLVMQFFWLYIDDLVGKGLGLFTILKLIFYVAETTVPLALPIAILLSSIMTFGNLGESFELVAIKSAGIPLLRFMRPLLIVSIIISGIAFLFANNIIPFANLKLNAMKVDFTFSKPAFDIKEGIFYNKIPGYVLKIGKKDKDGPGIYDILIYEQGNAIADNVITAKSGTMKVSDDKRDLEFIMKNGTRYEEKGLRDGIETDFTRLHFQEYKKAFDLSSFMQLKTADSLYKDNFKMLSVRQLDRFIDSIKKVKDHIAAVLPNETMPNFKFIKYFDSSNIPTPSKQFNPIHNIKDIIPDSAINYTIDASINEISGAKSRMDILYNDYKEREKDITHHLVEWHRKFSLSIACLILFLIGAPLGSIIRKGGIGTPLVFAIVFFVIFHLLNTFGEKLVKEGFMTPLAGMWLSVFVLTPIGFFLIYKAMRDSQLFNKDFYYKILKIIPIRKKSYLK